jgi:hypothetical protein
MNILCACSTGFFSAEQDLFDNHSARKSHKFLLTFSRTTLCGCRGTVIRKIQMHKGVSARGTANVKMINLKKIKDFVSTDLHKLRLRQ